MDDIIIVALNIHKNIANQVTPAYLNYENLSPKAKIDYICEQISGAIDELKNKHPNATWIIGWREYGISSGLTEKVVSIETENYLKEKLMELSLDHPNLVIVSGTMAVAEEKPIAYLEEIEKIYQESKWIQAELEEEVRLRDDDQVTEHYKQINIIKGKTPAEFYALRNTTYCIQYGEMQQHNKILPHNEIKTKQYENVVFQPGFADTEANHFNVKLANDEEMSIGIEICRENSAGLLKKMHPSEKPTLHILLSDDFKPEQSNMHGDYFIQFDSLLHPHLVQLNQQKTMPITLYSCDITNKNQPLQGPYETLYPFENRVIDKLTYAIKQTTGKQKEMLEAMLRSFKDRCDSTISTDLCHNISTSIAKIEQQLQPAEGFITHYSKYAYQIASTLFGGTASNTFKMSEFLNELKEMCIAEETRNPAYKDYCSRAPSPLKNDSPNVIKKLV